MSSATNKLSFTIRRPSPVSRASSTGADSDFKVPALPRHLSGPNSGTGSPLGRSSPKPKSRTYDERDSSDEDEEIEEELVTGFDEFGVQRLHEKKKPQGPLVIPALKNKDWREQARKRKALFIPPSAAATTGADGSVGGLGTRDTINSGPQAVGLQVKKRIKVETDDTTMEVEEETKVTEVEPVKAEEETEDQRAIRALLESAQGGDGELEGPHIEVIPAVTEDDAYRQDVVELPDPATLDDYERVPVSQFGAALLRGMGWKEGTGASRTGKGPVQPYLPQARPALLGIGAKEKEVLDDGSNKKAKKRPDRRYIPVIKKERRDGDRDSAPPSGSSSRRRTPSPRGSGSGSASGSRSRRSPSPSRRRDHDRDRYDRERDRRDRDRDGDKDRRRDDRDHRERDSSSRRDRDRDRDRDDRRRDRSVDKSQSRRDRDRRDH